MKKIDILEAINQMELILNDDIKNKTEKNIEYSFNDHIEYMVDDNGFEYTWYFDAEMAKPLYVYIRIKADGDIKISYNLVGIFGEAKLFTLNVNNTEADLFMMSTVHDILGITEKEMKLFKKAQEMYIEPSIR